MADSQVRRGALAFKGEKPLKKAKVRKPRSDDESGFRSPVSRVRSTPDVKQCEGRVVSNGTTLQGMETKFKEELEVGDVILVRHPQSLQMEERVVTGILSQRSLTVHNPFSSDFVSTTDFWVRKDSDILKHKLARKAQAGGMKKEEIVGDNEDDAPEQTVDQALQDALKRKLSKEEAVFTYQEKLGTSWAYKTVSVKVDKSLTQEDLLDMRCKKVHDKYC